MVNQNPEPIVLSETIELNAGENTGQLQFTLEMGSPEVMSIFAVYCYIYPGALDIGADDDYPLPIGRRTWTDIDGLYIPTANNPDRPDDSAGADPLFVTLPVCCNPRKWTDLTLELRVGSNLVPSKAVQLGVVDAKLDKSLPFSVPVKVKWNQDLFYTVTNNNPAAAAYNTWSKLDIMLNGEVINSEQTEKERAVSRMRAGQ